MSWRGSGREAAADSLVAKYGTADMREARYVQGLTKGYYKMH